MANTILALATLPRNIDYMTDAEYVALCEEPEFLAQCTPLELELIVRLGATLEVRSGEVNELQGVVDRLAQDEPEQVKAARQEAAHKALDALITAVEAQPKGRQVRVATS